jgi:hypothetical protein
MTKNDRPDGSELSEGLGPLPWGDIEAWLEVSDASQIASDIRAYADAEVARAVAAERERLRVLIVAHRDQTVMSQHVTLAECHAARNALQLVLDEWA